MHAASGRASRLTLCTDLVLWGVVAGSAGSEDWEDGDNDEDGSPYFGATVK